MTPKIICDSRELRSPILKELDKLSVDIQIETLPIADYILSDRVAVERKTIDDFWKSLIEERKLFGQLHDLTQYEIPILIIEGYEAELFTSRNVNPKAVDGVLNSIALMRIPIRYSVNAAGTAQIMVSIAEKEQTENKKDFSYHGKRSQLSKNEQLIYVISAIPDVGPVNAQKLLKYFGTIENISQTGISDLMCVDGIGVKTACAIRNIVTENYNRS
jgi:ERCC4-type nuclease